MIKYCEMKKFKLDKVNLAILNSIKEDSKINYSKLGKKLGLSHVAIKNRFENLLNKKLIKLSVLLNFTKLQFKLGFILLEVDFNALETLIKVYKKCPRVIYYYEMMGQYNLALLFFGENEKTFETILKSCMLYSLPGIHKTNILICREPSEDLFLPFNFPFINQDADKPLCGADCKNCGAFKQDRCFGCPTCKYYKGPLKISN